MLSRFLFAALTFGIASGPAWAANSRHPYQNIDRRVDAGNDTGDSQIDRLNRAQLNENYYRNNQGMVAPASPAPTYAPPYYGR